GGVIESADVVPIQRVVEPTLVALEQRRGQRVGPGKPAPERRIDGAVEPDNFGIGAHGLEFFGRRARASEGGRGGRAACAGKQGGDRDQRQSCHGVSRKFGHAAANRGGRPLAGRVYNMRNGGRAAAPAQWSARCRKQPTRSRRKEGLPSRLPM